MKIYHITDTHGFHNEVVIPKDIDVVIHSGDCSNSLNELDNFVETNNFLDWFSKVNVKHKIYVPGNHDTWIFKNERLAKQDFKYKGIDLLVKDYVIIDNIKFYGDPTTPTFGNWVYMSNRSKIHKHWDIIPEDTDVLITHGPPYGILDLNSYAELVGDKNLLKRIGKLNIRYHLFGHVHDNRNIRNHGILYRDGVGYSNATLVRDGNFSLGIVNKGNLINL